MSHAAKILTRRSLRRRHWIGLLVLGLLVLWSGVWVLAAFQFNHTVTKTVKDMRARGIELSYEKRSTGGNPWAVNILMQGFTLNAKSGAALKAQRAVFYMDLWDWGSISAKLRGEVEGKIADLPFKAGILKFGFSYPERAPLSYRKAGLSLWIQPFGLTFETDKPLAFGPTIAEGFAQLEIMGAVPDFASKESVMAWNEASGVIEFSALYLQWGALTVHANGTIGLSPSLQPEGAFSGRIEGLDQAVDALAKQGAITKRQEALVRSSIEVLARPSGLTGSSAPIVPVSLQNGGLYLGPVKLMKLPELRWE